MRFFNDEKKALNEFDDCDLNQQNCLPHRKKLNGFETNNENNKLVSLAIMNKTNIGKMKMSFENMLNKMLTINFD